MSDADKSAPQLTEKEKKQADSLLRPRPALLYEVVRREGEIELHRTFFALWWSGLAAGLSIGFSIVGMAAFRAYLPEDFSGAALIEPLGYTAGFLAVVLARQQLFTENTLTAVLPLVSDKTMEKLYLTARLWGTVLVANLAGALVFAGFLLVSDVLPAPVMEAAENIARHMMDKTPGTMFSGAILAGWLIAAMVWVLPASERNEFWVILFFTYVIGLIGASHIVAGSVEAFLLILSGAFSATDVALRFGVPTLLGNIIGGTTLFALISYAQVHKEKTPQED